MPVGVGEKRESLDNYADKEAISGGGKESSGDCAGTEVAKFRHSGLFMRSGVGKSGTGHIRRIEGRSLTGAPDHELAGLWDASKLDF